MKNNSISVIIPAYNAAKYISATIESVLNQSRWVNEIIVVNDGSTDNTMEVLYNFSESIILLNQTNKGRSSARNLGLKKSASEFVLFLDADDILLPIHIESLISYINQEYDIVYSRSKFFNNYDLDKTYFYKFRKYYDGKKAINILFQNYIQTPGCALIRKSKLVKYNIKFDSNVLMTEDYDFFARCILAGFSVKYSKKVTFLVRVHENNTMKDILNMSKNSVQVLKNLCVEFSEGKYVSEGDKKTLQKAFKRAELGLFLNENYKLNNKEIRYKMFSYVRNFRYFNSIELLRIIFIILWSFTNLKLNKFMLRLVYGHAQYFQEKYFVTH